MEDIKTAEKMAEQVNLAISDIKEMVTKSATVEALNAAVKEFETFKADNDTSEYEEKITALQGDIRKLTDKVGKISIPQTPGGGSLRDRIKSALDTEEWQTHLEKRAEGESPIYQL